LQTAARREQPLFLIWRLPWIVAKSHDRRASCVTFSNIRSALVIRSAASSGMRSTGMMLLGALGVVGASLISLLKFSFYLHFLHSVTNAHETPNAGSIRRCRETRGRNLALGNESES
jgi:hypothetical protein